MALTPAVERAVEELRASYPDHALDVVEDGQGGARVRVHDLFLGDQYDPKTSWIAFAITFQYPEADVYPHFLIRKLKRVDNAPLGEAFQQGDSTKWDGELATQLSRRSNNRNHDLDTAAIKLGKVLAWLRSQ